MHLNQVVFATHNVSSDVQLLVWARFWVAQYHEQGLKPTV